MEEMPKVEKSFVEIYDEAYEKILQSSVADGFIELGEQVDKVSFLQWLVKEKGVLLHGSNNQEIVELETRQANCEAKEFGNMKAVYAVEDCVLPTFYAIKDKDRFYGVAQSGFSEIMTDGQVEREYEFAVSGDVLAQRPWSNGAVYILPRETFVQGHDADGNLIDEWVSEVEVAPVGKIEITPDDFPYLDQVKVIESS